MNEDKLTINEVVDEFQSWIEEEFPSDMSPSEYRKAIPIIEELAWTEFNEVLESYPNLNCRFVEPFEFDINDPEFTSKIDNIINDHMSYLEEYCCDSSDCDDEW